ncbi:MAG: hypothetical protein RLZ10_810 [Bacteroidota bacterium]|jgi:O-antigen/teichoic acid export membrane protein
MLLRHSLSYLAIKSGPGLIGLLSVLIYTRILSPEEYGIYALVISGLGICYSIFFQWLSLSLGRFYGERGIHLGKFFSTSLYSFLLACLLSLIIWGIATLFLADTRWLKLIFFIPPLVITYAWYELNLRILNAQLELKLYGYTSFTKASLALLMGLLLYLSFGLYGIFTGLILSAVIAPLMWVRRIWPTLKIQLIDQTVFKKLALYGMPLAITIALTLIVDISDRFLITIFINEREAGLYSASYDLVMQIMGFVVATLYLAIFPILVKSADKMHVVKFNQHLNQYGSLLLAASVPLLIIFATLPKNISLVLLGPPFREAATQVMPVIAFGIFIGSIKIHFFDLIFQLKKRTYIQIIPALLTAIVNIILNIIWIPVYGISGAATATLIAFGVGFLASFVLLRYSLQISFALNDAFKILIAGLGMFVFLLNINVLSGLAALIFQIFSSLILYLLFIYFLDVANIKNLSRHYFFK